MRLPSLTTSPPMIAGSTVTSRSTSLPLTALRASAQRGEVLVLELLGDRDLAPSPRPCGRPRARGSRDHVAHREQAAVRGDQLEEFRREPADAGARRAPRRAPSAARRRKTPDCAPAGADRRFRATSASKRSRSRLHCVDGLLLARELEQRGRVAAGHAGNVGSSPAKSLALVVRSRGAATGAGSQRKPRGSSPWMRRT